MRGERERERVGRKRERRSERYKKEGERGFRVIGNE
jgi:hypothetical protein